ncbi:hypothetical protein AURDEDRAFT_163596 [Auricularia subglabra TFB-10046 SS5]|nr:hypothetical protein AURDEDRAFT_163596 [Auricularia subglabra TFB-10046 SS5]
MFPSLFVLKSGPSPRYGLPLIFLVHKKDRASRMYDLLPGSPKKASTIARPNAYQRAFDELESGLMRAPPQVSIPQARLLALDMLRKLGVGATFKSKELLSVQPTERGVLPPRPDHPIRSVSYLKNIVLDDLLDFSGDESPSNVLEGRVRSLAEALHASLVTIAPPVNELHGFEDLVAAAIEGREALTIRRAIEEEEERVLKDIKKKERQRMQREERGGVQIDMQDIDQLDKTKLLQLQVEQIDKEKRELTEPLRIVSKRFNHWERALRREELPLLKKDFERRQEEDRKTHELRTRAALEAANEHHAQEFETKTRLIRMMGDYNAARTVEAAVRAEEERKAHEKEEEIAVERAAERENLDEQARKRREREEETERRAAERAAQKQQERMSSIAMEANGASAGISWSPKVPFASLNLNGIEFTAVPSRMPTPLPPLLLRTDSASTAMSAFWTDPWKIYEDACVVCVTRAVESDPPYGE